MFADHYIGWIESRTNCIRKYTPTNFFKDKRVLEPGCGYAYIGNKISQLGATVTSTDAREEHTDIVNVMFPHITTQVMDCDKELITDKYDIIVHLGTLSHLQNPEAHLDNVTSMCNYLFLECEVSDSDNPDYCLHTQEYGYDQSIHNTGSRPSAAFIERVLAKNEFSFKMICNSILNYTMHNYTWESRNTNGWANGQRRFWICWRTGHVGSPFIAAAAEAAIRSSDAAKAAASAVEAATTASIKACEAAGVAAELALMATT